MRGRLTRLRSGAWLRRQRALFVPCVAMIAMACIAGFLTGAVPSGRPLGVEVLRFAVAALLASAVAFAVLVVTGWAVGSRSFGPSVQLFSAMLIVSATLWLTLTSPQGQSVSGVSFFTLTWILIVGSLIVWRFSEEVIRDWGSARRTRIELEESYRLTSRVNELLAAARSEWFGIYGAVVEQHVSHPIRDLRRRSSALDNAGLADAIDRLVVDIMRPLAQILHPVSVRAGIIASIQRMDQGLTPIASGAIRGLDAAGLLLDDDVRLQVYRWIRRLRPVFVRATVTVTQTTDSIMFDARPVLTAPSLDPVQQLAGLRVDSEGMLHAPLRGQVDVPSPAPARTRTSISLWRNLATPPVVSVRLAVLIAVLTVPGQWYGPSPTLLNATFTWAGVIGAGIGALVTIAAACIIAIVPWSRRGTGGPLWTITAWVLIGLVSGLCGLAVARNFDPLGFTAAAALSIVTRGVIRFALIGLVHQLARGYASRARADADQTRSQLGDARRMRSALLAHAEATERFVAESLHRSVQGRLAAIALLLRLGRRQEALTELDDTCDVTIPLMEGELIALSAEHRETVPSVVPAWLGMILIDRVDWDQVEALSPSLAYDLHRVVDECLVNAARHGAATSMEIHISKEVRRFTLHCQDNGRGGSIPHRVGLGSQLFTETCEAYGGTWQLLPSASGAEFTMTADITRITAR